MKKILCGILCASAGAALAVQSTVTTIDVIAVSSSLSNTVVAIPGLDLSGDRLAISNLVKTTNLTVNDKLIAFDNGSYQCWILSSGKKWEPFIDAMRDGSGESFGSGTPAASKQMLVGQGIWLLRQNTASPFYIYALHVASPSTTVAANATALVGNPTTSAKHPTITTPNVGDEVSIPTAGTLEHYFYTGLQDADKKWFSAGNYFANPPSIPAGTGFWYKSTGAAVTITWP